jgi:REP element-mobilizing transposase RayT
MARKLRVQYPGAIYPVMNRGDRREAIFTDDNDRHLYLETLGQACEKTDWQIHAWCLMSNHFHLVMETPRGNLVDGMQWLLGVYTNRFSLGSEEFRQELLEQVNHQAGPRHVGEDIRQSTQAKAERIIRAELESLGWNRDELRRRRKSDPSKVRMAARLRRETTMTLDWIAEQLYMGSAGHVSHLFYRSTPNPGETDEEKSQGKLTPLRYYHVWRKIFLATVLVWAVPFGN